MSDFAALPSTSFRTAKMLAAGPLHRVALAVRSATEAAPDLPVLVFDDGTGKVIDLDLRGGDAEILARLQEGNDIAEADVLPGQPPSRRGRPKLGVVAREVTLLPRHWEWLAAQPGGTSNALRRLTELAMRADPGEGRLRARREAAYRFMSAMAGNLAGFEEAIRALFAGDRDRFATYAESWPADIRAYAERLAWGEPLLAGTNG